MSFASDGVASAPNMLSITKRQALLSKVAFAFSAILSIYLCIISFLLPGITTAKLVAALAAFCLLVIGNMARHARYYKISAIGLVSLTILAVTGASISNNGLEGYVTPTLIIAPIGAALFLGSRATLISAIAVIISFALLLMLDSFGMVKPSPYSHNAVTVASFILLVMATAMCSAAVGFFASDSEKKIKAISTHQSELHFAAYHDALTKLSNRKHLSESVNDIIENPNNEIAQICFIHIDLDKFKPINDTYGHLFGDKVLQNIADTLRAHCQKGDLIARIGGDEFIILKTYNHVPPVSDAQCFCDELITKIKAPISVNGVSCELGASIGYVLANPKKTELIPLMKNSDAALYHAKHSGRAVAKMFTEDLRTRLEARESLINLIDLAFDKDDIRISIQPQFCLHTGKIIGVEILGRIRKNDEESLMPSDFLKQLARLGRMAEFDLRVLCLGLDALTKLRSYGHDIPKISVNASSEALRESCYSKKVIDALEARALEPTDLCVEMRESTLFQDKNDSALKTIETLRTAGISVVLDNFGSDHASISSLMRLNIDGFKIDRSLLNRSDSEQGLCILQAVHALSAGLNLPAIVEGVETSRQHATLRKLGFNAVQGFGFCEPLNLEALNAWLEAYGKAQFDKLNTLIKSFNVA